MNVTCFLPCRAGSERVKRKNIRPISKFRFGLVEIKLEQLRKCNEISEIVLSTNDADIIDFAEKLKISNLIIHRRGEDLSSSTTSTDDLVKHAYEVSSGDHILWTHVTSPFFTEKDYSKVIRKYHEVMVDEYDSLMTVNHVKGFFWDKSGPINYDRKIEKWPRTQTLNPLYEVNSAAFINSSKNYLELSDRVGRLPYLYKCDGYLGFDIDWPEDFIVAENLIDSQNI